MKPTLFPHARLQLEPLEDRMVPALDLTTVGATGVINGATFLQANPQPTGVGVINDFLRIQAHQGSVEQGYNTDFRNVQFDEKTDIHTRSIRVSELPSTTMNGVPCKIILLGVNQKQSSPLISLNELRLYVGNTPTLSGYNATTKQLGGLSAVYDMGTGNSVWLSAALTHGNGSGDMYLFVPERLLQRPDNADPYFYLYSKFGVNFGANGGFEQWAPGVGYTPPVETAGSLSGYVYTDANGSGDFDGGDFGILGAQVTLTQFNELGEILFSTTVATNQEGYYTFTGLNAGNYTITEHQPDGFNQGPNNLGTVDGVPNGESPGDDTFINIQLLAGRNGINYNFGELIPGEGG